MGKGWANKGHEIFFGVRHPEDEKIQNLLKDIDSNARASSNIEKVDFLNN